MEKCNNKMYHNWNKWQEVDSGYRECKSKAHYHNSLEKTYFQERYCKDCGLAERRYLE